MNKLLLIKDIKLMLKDLKFQIFFVILIILFVLSAISSSVTYQAIAEEYQNDVTAFQGRINDGYYTRMIEMLRENIVQVYDKPSPAVLFSSYENYPDKLINGVSFFGPWFMKYGSTGNFVFHLNWFFILGILSGFIMLIMSFEAISYEKRAGTLRILSIYGFKRQAFLWHKYTSYMLLYLIIIIPPALISLFLFFALTGTWSLAFMSKFMLIILISVFFASFFVLLGIFISMSKNYRSNIVMVIFIWLLFVIIIPQSANILAKLIAPLKTSIEYSQMGQEAWNNEWAKWNDEYNEKVGGNMNLQDGLRAAAVYASDEKRSLVDQIELNDSKRQMKIIHLISGISPFTQFEKISEIVFNKGFYLLSYQKETMRRKISEIKNLMIEQDSKDPNSLNLFYSWANGDKYATMSRGVYPFSNQVFEHPELLLTTDIETEDAITKLLHIIKRLIPILILNLLLLIASVIKLNKLDIR